MLSPEAFVRARPICNACRQQSLANVCLVCDRCFLLSPDDRENWLSYLESFRHVKMSLSFVLFTGPHPWILFALCCLLGIFCRHAELGHSTEIIL